MEIQDSQPAESPSGNLEQRHRQILQIWDSLPLEDAPLSSKTFPQLAELIEGLKQLEGINLLPLHKIHDFSKPVQAVALVDINDDEKEEILSVTQEGKLRCYTLDGKTLLAKGNLPTEAGLVIGIEVQFEPRHQIELAFIITENRELHAPNQVYEINLRSDGALIARADRRRRTQNQITTSAHFGGFSQEGLAEVTAVTDSTDHTFQLRGISAFGRVHTWPLTYRPFVITHTAEQVWLGDSQEKILCLRWTNKGFEPETNWPTSGLSVDGRLTALALWQYGTNWRLLIATDERKLLVADTNGTIINKISVPHVITALVPIPAENLLWIASEDKCLYLSRPLNLSLYTAAKQQPTLHAALKLLPQDERNLLIDTWLQGEEIAIAVRQLIQFYPSQPRWAYARLKRLNDVDPTMLSQEQAAAIIQAAESAVLDEPKPDQRLVENGLRLANKHYSRSTIQTQRRIDLYTGRLSALQGSQITSNPDYKELSASRRDGDLAKAKQSFEQGQKDTSNSRRLEEALNIYAKVIVQRRQINWTFGNIASIRTLTAIPNSACFLLADRRGMLYLLNIETRKTIRSRKLPEGAIPRTVAIGPLVDSAVNSLALVTADGSIYVGPANPEDCLLELTHIHQVDADVWGMALYPAQAESPAQLIISCRHGQLMRFYCGQAAGWQKELLPPVDAAWLATVHVVSLADAEPPVILAGGGSSGTQGILHLLNLDGSARFPAIQLDSPVIDIRTINHPDSQQKAIAVACANGSLYLLSANGVRLWRYRMGRAARSLTVCDIDGDGFEEIIVGGERPQEKDVNRHLVMVLGAHGEIQWVIPAQAAVTHVAAVHMAEKNPQLLIGDLGHTIQVVAVNPPRGITEEKTWQWAQTCLELLAERQHTTSLKLSLDWLKLPPSNLIYLQAYAYHYCAMRAAEGNTQALDALLAIRFESTDALMHRAYARALVYLATSSHTKVIERVIERLTILFAGRDTYREAGIATMRALMLPNNLQSATLQTWSPLLNIGARHPHADVQRAVLYALRALMPKQSIAALDDSVWQILRTVVASDSDENIWVYEATAALLRDLSHSDAELWHIVHLTLLQLNDLAPRILNFLGRAIPPFLENQKLAEAIEALVELQASHNVTAARSALAHLNAHIIGEQFIGKNEKDTLLAADLNEMFEIMGKGANLSSFRAWADFISHRMEVSLRRLEELAARPYLEAIIGRFNDYLKHMRDDIATFRDQRLTAVTIGRLRYDLEELSNLILSSKTGNGKAQITTFSPLSTALVGMMSAWYVEGSVLGNHQDQLNRPAEPELKILNAIKRYDEFYIEAYVWNPSEGSPIYELDIRLEQVELKIGTLNLACHTELAVPKNLTLSAQQKRLLRFRIVIPTWQREKVASLRQNKIIVGTLHVPTHFIQNGGTRRQTLTSPINIQVSNHTNLDYERSLPHAWQTFARELMDELRQSQTKPIFISATPFVRSSIIHALQRNNTNSPQSPVVDWRAWLDQIFILRRNDLHTEEGSLLQWLTQQIWPQFVDYTSWHASLSPRTDFKVILADPLKKNPKMIIFNHWDRLLAGIGRHNHDLHPLNTIFPFLVKTLVDADIRPVFIGQYLSSEIMRTHWPSMTNQFTFLNANHIDIENKQIHAEMTKTVEKVLVERDLHGLLRRFPDQPVITFAKLVDVSRGYLTFFEFVMLPALEDLNQAPPLQFLPLQEYLLRQADHNNFFSLAWAWQSFFERITLVLAAHCEIPLERRNFVTEGLVLSRDYYARRPDGRPVPTPTFAAGTQLTKREVTSIGSNAHYQNGDAWIQGFDPSRPLPEEWGESGKLFMQLFRAGNTDNLLQRMVDNNLLHIKNTKHLNQFYELAIPLQVEWIKRVDIWNHMRAAAQSALDSWFPRKLGLDQRRLAGKLQKDVWLFPTREPTLAYKDIPVDVLPEIDKNLSRITKPLFFNLYGIAGKDSLEAERLWGSLEALARTNKILKQKDILTESDHAPVREMFNALSHLLKVSQINGELKLDSFEQQFLPWTMVQISGKFGALQEKVLLAVLKDGRILLRDLYELRDWVKVRLGVQSIETINRTVVIIIVLSHGERLLKTTSNRDDGPHFVFLDVPQLTQMALTPNPQQQLINHAFKIVGRHSFTPYRLAGSLAAGSPLFVGRGSEISTVLSSLTTQDHAILGSRRIGKTSLLKQIHHRLITRPDAEKLPVLFIQLQEKSRASDFYRQVKRKLIEIEHNDLAQKVPDKPDQDHAALYAIFQALKQHYDHPVIILMDEIDDLYLHDLRNNHEQLFQFFRNQLAQSTPRICTFVMTGFRHIYLNRLRHGSAFYNFCRFHNLVGVGQGDVARLVRMLKDFSLKITDEDEIISMITQGTYGIPYYVQLVCDDLLSRVDRRQQDQIAPSDVQAVLQGNLRMQLKRELWDDLDVDPLLTAMQSSKIHAGRTHQMIKARIILLTTILTRYQHKFDPAYSQAIHTAVNSPFTAVDALTYLRDFKLDLGAWQPTEAEIDHFLRAMTMTLALAPVSNQHSAYMFPNDILPDVLFYHQQQGTLDLLYELMRLVEMLGK